MAEKREWYENLIHDLKAPLASMRLTIDAVQYAGSLNEAQIAYIDKAIKYIDKMSEMISSSLEKLGRQMQRVEVNLDRLIAACVEMVEARAQQRGIAVQVDVPAGVGTVIAEASAVESILQNLLTNAIEYNVDGGRVTLRAEGDQHAVRISISDTGQGIAPEDQAHVFERGVTSGRGNGIGLAIVKAAVERHGGEVTLESELGRGTTVVVTLPRGSAGEQPVSPQHEAESEDSKAKDDPVVPPPTRMPNGDQIMTIEVMGSNEPLDVVDDDSQEGDDFDSSDEDDPLV
jgi:two-component system sensor histidine kinase VicK